MGTGTITAAARKRREEILTHLRKCPGLTATQLSLATGRSSSSLLADLKALAADGRVRSLQQREPVRRQPVSTWFCTSAGPVTLDAVRHKKNQDYVAKCSYHAGPELARPLPGAACTGADPGLFFAETEEDEAAAKAICRRCPVRVSCLDGARARRERFGIWGGVNFEDRPLPRKRAGGVRRQVPGQGDTGRQAVLKARYFAGLRQKHESVNATARAAGVDWSTARFWLDLGQLDSSSLALVESGEISAHAAVTALRQARQERGAAS